MNQWFYMSEGLLGTNQVGPIAEIEIKKLARDGKLKLETMVSSPALNGGKWTSVSEIKTLSDLLVLGHVEREKIKAQLAQKREQERQDREAAAARKKQIKEIKKNRDAQLGRAKLLNEIEEESEHYADPETHGRLLLEISKRLSSIIQFLWFFFWVAFFFVVFFLINGCTFAKVILVRP